MPLYLSHHRDRLIDTAPCCSSSHFYCKSLLTFSTDKICTLDQGILALRSRKRQSGFIVDFIKRPEAGTRLRGQFRVEPS
ncbi:hypothetical protein [Shewanella sp. 1180_01]|uniref:hypothetical protein n=1 Tax=Shewanella sp. 1180_01 TaxID=2604451 RepID=UPI004063E354